MLNYASSPRLTPQVVVIAWIGCIDSTLYGSRNEVQGYSPWRCNIGLCRGACASYCDCQRRSARPAPAGHDEGLLPGWSMGLRQPCRVRRRQVPRRVVLAPVDENLASRPSVLLRLRRRGGTPPGPATAWLSRPADSP